MFEITNLTKQFHTKKDHILALDDLSFHIKKGEIFGVIGKSGVGKSTLLKILSFQIPFDDGQFIFDGKSVKELNQKEKRDLVLTTSYIHQSFSLLYNLNVLDNIALPLIIRGTNKNDAYLKAKEMLDFVGLSSKALSYPITLSGGEAQRIAIARALVTNPKVIYADEPTSSLDDETSYEILNLLLKVNNEFNTTIIFVSHQTNLVKYICHRVLLLENGKIKRLSLVKNNKKVTTNYEEIIWGEDYV